MRYWIDEHGPVPAAVSRGILWLSQVVLDDKVGYLAVPIKRNVKHGTISDAIGDAAAKALVNGTKSVTLPSGHDLRLFTKKTAPGIVHGEPILVVYPDVKLLEVVDGIQGVSDILVVPWTLAEVEPWVEKWGAEKYEG
jgi:hypothetical protein